MIHFSHPFFVYQSCYHQQCACTSHTLLVCTSKKKCALHTSFNMVTSPILRVLGDAKVTGSQLARGVLNLELYCNREKGWALGAHTHTHTLREAPSRPPRSHQLRMGAQG